jgi:diguanylate cyclase (GGDEF)-like protein/PAS domain S-box-containing protein
MHPPRILPNEAARLLALAEYDFDAEPGEASLDPIVELARRMFNVPMAVVNLIDRDHVFFAASAGIGEVPPSLARREISFCAHAITQEDVLVVQDALLDPRFHDNPLVTGEAHFRFYAGVPLVSPGGQGLGAFCIIDTHARSSMSDADLTQLKHLAGLVLDRLELRRLDVARRASQARFEQIMATSPDAIICSDADGVISIWNEAATALFGHSASEMTGRNLDLIIPERFRTAIREDRRTVIAGSASPFVGRTNSLVGLRKDGVEFPIELSLSMWRENGAPSFGAIIRDITERSRYEQELFQLAHHDALTGLPNRNVLTRRLDEEIAARQPTAIVVIDIDGFKTINAALGQRIGDALLQEAARRLGACVRAVDTVCRLGGDDYALLLPGVGDPLTAATAAETALEALSRPLCIDGYDVQISACAGIALFPAHSENSEELLGNADLALYQAKTDGKSIRRLFMQAMRHAALARRSNDIEIRRAIENQEFRVFFQPQVRLADGALVGAEALLRWEHPERGLISPAAFFPMLENGLLSAMIGQWVMETACAQAARWRGAGTENFRMGVNLFGSQFHADDLADRVLGALEAAALPPEALELEITENIILAHDDAILDPLRRLRKAGVGIAFDDFGTGFASLSMLKRFPITRLKIDQTFVRTMCTDKSDEAVVRSILFLGDSLGLDVIAEGIETSEQRDRLRALACTEGQGYHFGKALSAEAFSRAFELSPWRFDADRPVAGNSAP